jgi:Fe-S oxidoreductase
MALADYQQDMETCCRCSTCKFITLENVKGVENSYICPSIARYNFHGYSGGGRIGIGIALLEKKLDYSDKLLEMVYNCQMCGGCDVSCKYAMDMEVFEPISEVRISCVENGKTLPVFDKMMEGFRRNGRLVPAAKTQSKNWFDGMKRKDFRQQKVDVIFHAGCRTSADRSLWKVAQSSLALMQKASIDVGIAGAEEQCCGGRAYYLGYKTDFLKRAEHNMKQFAQSGAKTLVTGCAECYQAYKVLYDRFGFTGNLEVLHTTEYFTRLIREGKLIPSRKINLNVTYHDPCYLGRLGEPWIHWKGKQIPGQIRLFNPPREFRRGSYGVYAPPRELLKSLPGLTLTELDRTREYAWCCGAGGGVKESNPDFAAWTADIRLKEAEATGAEALITACPGCEKSFTNALKNRGSSIQIYDIIELLAKAAL